MIRNVISLFLVSVFGFQFVSTATIFDLLWTGSDLSPIEGRQENVETDNQKSCSCIQSSCKCCVDFNMTYIDLGGPGCVQMRYISQDEGISVNVSYGESLLHSEEVKGPNPKPTCISILSNLAEVCARFSSLEPHNDGLKGCLLLEPKLLGDIQTQFDIGCFLMGPDGMKLDPNSNSTLNQLMETNLATQNTTEVETETEGFNEEEIIAAVSESASQGLLFFGNLLGLAFGNSDVNNTESSPPQEATNSSPTEASRKAKMLSSKLNQI